MDQSTAALRQQAQLAQHQGDYHSLAVILTQIALWCAQAQPYSYELVQMQHFVQSLREDLRRTPR